MTDHDHDDHEHHHHALSWEDELAQLRAAARDFYMHQFNWRGEGPPEDFDGPRYFDPAPDWQLEATLDATVPHAGETVELATSTGQVRKMTNAGQLVFNAAGREHRLTAFATTDAQGFGVLFVPFRDATSGSATYGAGRYLEVPYERDDEVLDLDFNYAYNPSCVYSSAYDCPYPPPANRLEVAVEAGERMPFDKADA
jgi:uncharacterized protein (DUF1684 family)